MAAASATGELGLHTQLWLRPSLQQELGLHIQLHGGLGLQLQLQWLLFLHMQGHHGCTSGHCFGEL